MGEKHRDGHGPRKHRLGVHRLKQSGRLRMNITGHQTMAEFSWDSTARHVAPALAA